MDHLRGRGQNGTAAAMTNTASPGSPSFDTVSTSSALNGSSSYGGDATSPDLNRRRCIDVSGGPSTLPAFHTVLDRPRHRETSAQPAGKWRRMLRGPSVDNAFASLRTRWRKHGETHFDSDISTNSVKWRRSPSSDMRASLRAARSASLISFVAKSVEEFRNGVLRSWRHCAPTLRDDSITNGRRSERHSTATAVATELVRRRGLTSFLANDQKPSTSEAKFGLSARSSIPEILSVDTDDSGNSGENSITKDDCVDDGISLSSDSYRFFGFYENEQQALSTPEEANTEGAEGTRMKRYGSDFRPENTLHVDFSSSLTKNTKRSSKTDNGENSRSSSINRWSVDGDGDASSSVSDSAGSLHNDRSRYDNVSPGEDDVEDDENAGGYRGGGEEEGKGEKSTGLRGQRYVATPLSFYELPQNNIKTVRSSVQLYFL